MKKKILVLASILALVAALVVPMAVMADAGDTTVTANFESITITAPTGESDLVLNTTGSNNLITTADGEVTSNVAYDVTAVDALEDSKDTGDTGQMVSWTSNVYASGVKIAAVVNVGSTHAQGVTAAPLNIGVAPAAITIINAAPAGTAVDSNITVTVVTASESALTSPAVYKITITFTAVAD